MSVEVSIDMSAIERMFSAESMAKAKWALSEAVGSDSNTVVPMDKGDLRRTMTVTEEGVEWRQDYAQAVYYMDDATTNWTTADTHSRWVEFAKARYGDDWEKVVLEQLMEGKR